eukprot:8356111-Pyramimonas_sp.AAC.1
MIQWVRSILPRADTVLTVRHFERTNTLSGPPQNWQLDKPLAIEGVASDEKVSIRLIKTCFRHHSMHKGAARSACQQ